MVARGGFAVAVVGGDVARRADGEVHRAVRSDGDALQRVRVRAAQIGAPGVGQAGRHGAAVGRCAVGVVVGVDLIALGDVERVARERQPVRLVQPVERHRHPRAGSARLEAHHLPTARHGNQQAPSGAHAASRALGTRAHTDSVQPAGTSACRGSSNGAWARSGSTCTVHRDRRPAAVGVGDSVEGVGLDEFVEHAATSATPISATPIRLRSSQTRMHLPNQNLRRVRWR